MNPAVSMDTLVDRSQGAPGFILFRNYNISQTEMQTNQNVPQKSPNGNNKM